MIALLGLVTDVGYMHYVKKSAQASADAAVLAAIYRFHATIPGSTFACTSYSWICHTDPWQCPAELTTATNPLETACLYAKKNGFYPTAGSRQNVTLVSNVTSTIPTAPGVAGVSWWITARVTQTVPQLFSAILGNRTGLVAARASAAVHPGEYCVYTLDPSSAGSFHLNGGATFQSACGIYVDSSNATDAVDCNGSGTIQGSSISVVGGVTCPNATLSPAPQTNVDSMPDPLLDVLSPPSPCSATTGCSAVCGTHSSGINVTSDTTFYPGVYCGGIAVKNATATFVGGGPYIIVGGGISTQDTNSHVRGSGVFFYNTYNSHNSYTPVNFNANSDVQLSAATDGDYKGTLFMQDRGCCSGTVPTESFQGGANSFFEGILYFPRSLIEFQGNPSMSIAHYTVIISWRLQVSGASFMNNDFSHLVGGNPLKTEGLVE